MLDAALCRVLHQSLGSDRHLVVVALANGLAIRRSTTLPSLVLAVTRFEAAVFAANADWIAAGPFTDMHMGMVLPALPQDLETAVRASMARYSREDPWKGAGWTIALEAVVTSVPCRGATGVPEILAQAEQQLAALGCTYPEKFKRMALAQSCGDGLEWTRG